MIVLLSVKIKGVTYGISFGFFAVTALLFLCAEMETGKFLSAFLCCVLHESGHIFFMLLFGRTPGKIILYGGGIKIVPQTDRLISQTGEIIILLGGCLFNFLASVIGFISGRIDFFCLANIFLGIFNLLPFRFFHLLSLLFAN